MSTKNPGPVYPSLKPWDLEPHYAKHVSAMTTERLDGKAAIAEQLAWRDQTIVALGRIIERTLACGQLEKLESARIYLARHAMGLAPEASTATKRQALAELEQLVKHSKWLDTMGSKEAARGRAYEEGMREMRRKYGGA